MLCSAVSARLARVRPPQAPPARSTRLPTATACGLLWSSPTIPMGVRFVPARPIDAPASMGAGYLRGVRRHALPSASPDAPEPKSPASPLPALARLVPAPAVPVLRDLPLPDVP